MNIFGNFIIFQRITGLDPQGGRRNTMVRIVYLVLFISFYLSTAIFVALNFHQNIDQALYDVTIINGNSAFALTFSYLSINRKQFYSLLADMEDILYKSV